MDISVLICTRNRAEHLSATLQSLRHVEAPAGRSVELVVIDNGSTDHTQQVIGQFTHPTISCRSVVETRPGLSCARNCGLNAASGDIILFTDDDVRFPRNWLVAMTAPMLDGEAEVVAGAVHMAGHLRRDWMYPIHYGYLSCTDLSWKEPQPRPVGANIGFTRRAKDQVGGFDEELGAGTDLVGEDDMFISQLLRTGLVVRFVMDTWIEHHFEEFRISRASFIQFAKRVGKFHAYRQHNWEHAECEVSPAVVDRLQRALLRKRVRRFWEMMHRDRAPFWELVLISDIYRAEEWMRIAGTPRKYAKFGLQKLTKP